MRVLRIEYKKKGIFKMEFNFSMVIVINVRIVNEYVDVDDFVLYFGGV